ncbi:phosphotransferase [Pseudooceanicola sp. 216_PA32_1]|uniref:Phosphotransferase n=1 Tax=Pseudooceanicola pacificus TaxID=2676438 RepID=A0A844WE59_9RHOB|nr:phosphotransferase family protein [Pseudooceanicola pacificus]MWB78140.1 phosphotransferase [Pseudooceanicola pacificus]
MAEVTRLEFDAGALRRWLSDLLGPEDRFELSRISGGQSNPTFFLDWGDRRLVLRKQPPGPILKGAHAVDREHRVMAALAGTEVPVPPVLAFEADATVIGTPFYVMERVEGRVFGDAALPGLSPDERRGIYLSLAETLARLRNVRPEDVGLGDYGRPGDYFSRQMSRWGRQLEQSASGGTPELHRLRDWLEANKPEDDGRIAISHGDFRVGNMLIHPTEPRVICVLDWELSTLGHPLADLGFCCMPWHTASDEYGGALDLDRATLGIPSQQEFVERYQAHARDAGELTPFHTAFALFRFAVIFVGIADRALAGTASDPKAERLGPLAHRFALRGLDTAQAAA